MLVNTSEKYGQHPEPSRIPCIDISLPKTCGSVVDLELGVRFGPGPSIVTCRSEVRPRKGSRGYWKVERGRGRVSEV